MRCSDPAELPAAPRGAPPGAADARPHLWPSRGPQPAPPSACAVPAAHDPRRAKLMHAWGWWLLGIIYLVLLFTLAVMTFRKGHWILGLIGFFFPILWIIGAILPGKRYAR